VSQSIRERLLSLFFVGGRKACVSDELFLILSRCERNNSTVFLFGGQLQTVYALRDIVHDRLPDLKISGICDGEFQGMPSVAVMTAILRSRPDVIVIDLDRRCARAFVDFWNSHAPGGVTIRLAGAFDKLVRRELGPKAMSVGLYPDFGLGRMGRAVASFTSFLVLLVAQKLQQGRGTNRRLWTRHF